MNVTIVGASGFVGRHLTRALNARGDVVTPISLRDPEAAAAACAGADAVVNLAGEPVSQRWTPDTKKKIRTSRVDAPAALIAALGKLSNVPKAYVAASAIGYYGRSETATFDESSGPGSDFLSGVCVEWEATADRAAAIGARVAKVRTGIALGTDGGALASLLPLFKLGLGGNVASGRQWYSWIHIDDLVGIYVRAIDGTEGVLNASAPNPVTNADFTSALGTAVHRFTILPVPAFAVQAMLGEAAIIVTEGQRVLPKRTLETGYTFAYPQIDGALAALLRR
jgi:uncharacterized protein (TIGR01777 family)